MKRKILHFSPLRIWMGIFLLGISVASGSLVLAQTAVPAADPLPSPVLLTPVITPLAKTVPPPTLAIITEEAAGNGDEILQPEETTPIPPTATSLPPTATPLPPIASPTLEAVPTEEAYESVEEPLFPPTFTPGGSGSTPSAGGSGGPVLTPAENGTVVMLGTQIYYPTGTPVGAIPTVAPFYTLRPYPTRTKTNPLTPTPTPLPTRQPEVGDVWTDPLNLSRAGASSLPMITVGDSDSLHAIWWDEFSFAQYAASSGNGWSAPQTIPNVLGALDRMDNNKQLPPESMEILVNKDWVHIFWLDPNADLMHTRSQVGSSKWSKPIRLATAPAAWNFQKDSNGTIHLAFIRTLDTEGYPQGVYYRATKDNGNGWLNSVFVHTSPYFRVLAETSGHVSLAVKNDVILVGWDDPQFSQSFFARSIDAGTTFTALERVESLEDRPAQGIRFLALPDQESSFLRIWSAGNSCTFYQQLSTDDGKTWSNPQRILETLEGCLDKDQSFSVTDGQLFYTNTSGRGSSTKTTFMAWDGTKWSDPFNVLIEYQNRTTLRSSLLQCTNSVLADEYLYVIGCDQEGDILVSRSVQPAKSMLPTLEKAWSAPQEVSNGVENVSVPVAVSDSSGTVHGLWGEAISSLDPSYRALTYIRGDGKSWSALATALDVDERLESPALTIGPDGVLHAVWSAGNKGVITYSRTFGKDAVSENSWLKPIALPSVAKMGGSPAIAIAPNGTVHVIYAIPLNEQRGIYHVSSTDQGLTWSEPHRVFDGVEADWLLVRDASLAIDSENRLHAAWAQTTLPGSDQPLGIYYSYSDDDGKQWKKETMIDGAGAGKPQIGSWQGEVHLAWVKQAANGLQLWSVRSLDGGDHWEQASDIPEFQTVSATFGLVTAEEAGVFLVATGSSSQNTAAILFTRWNGTSWADFDSVPLGVPISDSMGARGVWIAADHSLGAFYRVQSVSQNGSLQNRIGFLQRATGEVSAPDSAASPRQTLTPLPLATGDSQGDTATATPESILTPLATVAPESLQTTAPRDSTSTMIKVGGIVAGMAALSAGILWVRRRTAG